MRMYCINFTIDMHCILIYYRNPLEIRKEMIFSGQGVRQTLQTEVDDKYDIKLQVLLLS